MYIKILIYAFIVFLFFRAFNFLYRKLPFSLNLKHYIGYLLPVAELIAWVGFVIWCVTALYSRSSYNALILLGILFVLLVVPLWFLLRDFLFGIVLKIQRKIDVGGRIQIEHWQGIVVKAGHFSFDIKTPSGNVDTIPYNKVRSKIISTSGSNVNLQKHLISFDLRDTHQLAVSVDDLKTLLINAPWVAESQAPIIHKVSTENGITTVDFFIYTLSDQYVEKIKNYVINRIA